jgi:AbrB family looped-hinge helix DNA binding protein
MREAVATITSKGQVTLPIAIRRHLGVGERDRVAFVVGEDGSVTVRPIKYPTVASLQGIAGSLPQPRSWEEMRDIAYEERLARKLAPDR